MDDNKILINNYENLIEYKKLILSKISDMEDLRENNINHSDTFIDINRIDSILTILYEELNDIDNKLFIMKWLRMTKISVIRNVFNEISIDPLPDEENPKLLADYIISRLQLVYDISINDIFKRINDYMPE